VVLLVDDDRNDQALFSLAVAQTNSSIWVQTACDEQEAEDYLNGRGRFADRDLHPYPDMVLLDLKMDVGDGFDFLDWRQQHPQFSSLPVVIFTGSHYQADIKRAMAMGANAHVSKPLTFNQLKMTIQEIWELGKQLHISH
jgi:CheY-like chemotaxis protein